MRNYWHHPSIHFGRAAKYRSAIFIFYLTQIYWNTLTHTHTYTHVNTHTNTRTHLHKYAHTQWEYQEPFVALCEHLPIHHFLVCQNNIARSQLPHPLLQCKDMFQILPSCNIILSVRIGCHLPIFFRCNTFPLSLLHIREFWNTNLLPISEIKFHSGGSVKKSGQYGNFLSRYFLSFCSCTTPLY